MTAPSQLNTDAKETLVMPGWFLNYLDGIEHIGYQQAELGLTHEEYRESIANLDERYREELMAHGLLYWDVPGAQGPATGD